MANVVLFRGASEEGSLTNYKNPIREEDINEQPF